jgi:hypothetical protein
MWRSEPHGKIYCTYGGKIEQLGEAYISETSEEATRRVSGATQSSTITSGTIIGDYEILDVM